MGIIYYENRNKACTIAKRDALGFAAHLHKEIEVVYMLGGQTKAYLDSKEYILNEGDFFIAFPNKVHYYNTYAKEKSFLLIFSPDVFPDFENYFMKNDPVCPVIRKENLPENIETILENAYSAFSSNSIFKIEKCKGYFNVLLGEILPCLELNEVTNNNTDMLSSILTYCVENYKDSISLDTMAQELHASKYYISRLFSEKIKIGFNDYINMLRINDAKECLIKTDDSITQIGTKVGYNTIRSFNRAFLSQTGMQPREYRNAYKNGNFEIVSAKEEKKKEVYKENSEVIFYNNDCDCCF